MVVATSAWPCALLSNLGSTSTWLVILLLLLASGALGLGVKSGLAALVLWRWLRISLSIVVALLVLVAATVVLFLQLLSHKPTDDNSFSSKQRPAVRVLSPAPTEVAQFEFVYPDATKVGDDVEVPLLVRSATAAPAAGAAAALLVGDEVIFSGLVCGVSDWTRD